MKTSFKKYRRPYWRKRPFEYIALWQSLSFFLLICLIWVHETFDLTAIFFGTEETAFNYMGASILTAFVITVGFITIAHTYLQQRKTMEGFITICSYCKKVQINQAVWEQIDEFIEDKSLITFSHGICPECLENCLKDTDMKVDDARGATVDLS
ncbi:MAG: hypothetical protein EOM20_08230 [Spartobacteria bacterium]|nr:hypothetical protein [Spartobacteria bacterium]